ncbi:MAG: hypothetical protein ABI461_05450 [Polyangiaceae bacterium]
MTELSKSMKASLAFAFTLAASLVCTERNAHATNVTEFPDNGSEQMGRGGAWVARASDPLAAFYNPAGLAGQNTRLTIQVNINTSHTCFTRQKAANDTTQEPLADANGVFPRVCNDIAPFPDPQIAITYKITDRLGAAFLFVAPSAAGTSTWPRFINNAQGAQPSPNRYQLTDSNTFFVTPTIAIGGEVIDGLRLGASFQWGIAKAKFATGAPAVNQENSSPRGNDVESTIIASDYFIPGFTLGALYSPTDFLDVAGWYKWSDSIKARGDVYTQANYYTPAVASGNISGVKDGDSSLSDCNYGSGSACGNGNNAFLHLAVPMEAKLGFRYHKPRYKKETTVDPNTGVITKKSHMRDPIADDVFDIELDGTWANNKTMDGIEIRFPGDANQNGTIPVNGTGGSLPPITDQPVNFKDVYGLRLGGDYNILPDQLALRASTFFETKAQDSQYQQLAFIGGQRFGLAAGGTYRIKLDRVKKNAIEVSLGYEHVFVGTQSNDNAYAAGVNTIAGTACNPGGNSQNGYFCSDGRQKYRVNWPTNLGTITNSINVINVGVTYKF